jgi:hypothetical protein
MHLIFWAVLQHVVMPIRLKKGCHNMSKYGSNSKELYAKSAGEHLCN